MHKVWVAAVILATLMDWVTGIGGSDRSLVYSSFYWPINQNLMMFHRIPVQPSRNRWSCCTLQEGQPI